MNDDDKRKYDAWVSLRDHAWLEFQEKTRLEWRVSFGIWLALLASSGAILGASFLKASSSIEFSAWAAVIVVILVHVRFLLWIQSSLGRSREYQREAEAMMRELLHATAIVPRPRKPSWKQPYVMVQILITVLVSATLLLVVNTLPN